LLTSTLIDGKSIAENRLDELQRCNEESGRTPSLHVIFVGEDEASESYIRMKEEKAERVGMNAEVHRFPADATPDDVRGRIRDLNEDPDADGIIVQLPLPDSFDENALLETVSPEKDVDGLHPVNFGKLLGASEPHFYPPTPKGIMTLLEEYDVELEGAVVALVGMGRLVGRPLSQMLLNERSTVLCLNKYTPDLGEQTRRADIVVAGAGVPELVKEEHVEPGTVVIDAGIHRQDGELVGDVAFEEVAEVARLITPVPGGVGPLTVVGLLENTEFSARRRS
jgi:methylenetetrahydrofolate dehydrogenase (NADP+)/methenyltetrahydrofolate cyclohydrolase